MKTYKKASKDKYGKKLFSIADEMEVRNLPRGSGYLGITSNDIDAEDNIRWYYIADPDSIDKDRFGGDMVEIFGGLLDCDEFGNLFPTAKQKTITKNGKTELKGRGIQLPAETVVLYVNEKTDVDWDKYEKMSSKARQNNPPMVTFGPRGTDNGFEARLERRAAKKSNDERKARWSARGELYSPWGSRVKWPKEFLEMVETWRNNKFTGKHTDVTEADLFVKAKEFGVDTDELAQYLSEASGALSDAIVSSYRSNN